MHITTKQHSKLAESSVLAAWGTLHILHAKSMVLFLQDSKDTKKWCASGDWEAENATTLNLQYFNYWRLWIERIQDTKGNTIINVSRAASCTATWRPFRAWNVVQPQGEPQVSSDLEKNLYSFVWLYLGFVQNLSRNIHICELCVGPKFWPGTLFQLQNNERKQRHVMGFIRS